MLAPAAGLVSWPHNRQECLAVLPTACRDGFGFEGRPPGGDSSTGSPGNDSSPGNEILSVGIWAGLASITTLERCRRRSSPEVVGHGRKSNDRPAGRHGSGPY